MSVARCSVSPYKALGRRLQAEAAAKRSPLYGTIEFTGNCNLSCGHCYVRPRRGRAQEQTTEDLCAILDKIAAAGCLWLGITGGEPLLRPDFAEVYERAKRCGFLVTLLTNGTLVTVEIAELLRRLPPVAVEVSLYGASADTYRAVTGSAEAFDRCMFGIELLRAAGVAVRLKTTVTSMNAAEVPRMRRIAEAFGGTLRVDPWLHGHLDGHPFEPGVAVGETEAVGIELEDPSVRREWRALLRSTPIAEQDRGLVFDCDAGVTTFHVDALGRLTPCIMVREPASSLHSRSFSDVWNGPIRTAVSRRWAGTDTGCGDCTLRAFCTSCAGWNVLETGRADGCVERLCRAAAERRQRLAEPGAREITA